jgi:hypothetical protein
LPARKVRKVEIETVRMSTVLAIVSPSGKTGAIADRSKGRRGVCRSAISS